MTVQEYIRDYLPAKFGVHPAFGIIAELVLLSERTGKEAFAHENFGNPRDRAALGIPYQVENLVERERVLNVLEYLILKHREIEPGENHGERMVELYKNTEFTPEEFEMITSPRDFWGG